MPGFMRMLSVVGTAAMIWVGGGIVLHGAEELGLGGPAHAVHAAAAWAAGLGGGAAEWLVGAALAGVVGLALGGVIAWSVGQAAKLRGV
jgi:predicted DNA repair protein MutK